MTALGNQISKNVIDTMNTSDNPSIDKEEGTKKRSHSCRAKAIEEDEEHSRRKRQKLRNNCCRDKSQMQVKRKVREVSVKMIKCFAKMMAMKLAFSHCHPKMKWT